MVEEENRKRVGLWGTFIRRRVVRGLDRADGEEVEDAGEGEGDEGEEEKGEEGGGGEAGEEKKDEGREEVVREEPFGPGDSVSQRGEGVGGK